MVEINGINEEILIKRFVNGDKTAFELLFKFYYSGLVIYTSQIVLDRDEAEGIVQDFFVNLWENRNHIKKTKSLKGYFFVSVKNRALNSLKREKITKEVHDEIKYMVENDQLYNSDLFVVSELQQRIKKAFEKLPPRANEVFTLSRLKGFKNNEIAEKLNLSKRTVETHISNALRILREELKDYMFLMLLL